jgi:histone H3/H4
MMIPESKKQPVKMVVEARVREVAGEKFKLAGEFMENLNAQVEKLVVAACQRAEANGRVTLKGQDV